MKDKIKCPCENCICVPICRYKSYNKLVTQCSLINKYLVEPYKASKRPISHLQKLKEILTPEKWDINNINSRLKFLYIKSSADN